MSSLIVGVPVFNEEPRLECFTDLLDQHWRDKVVFVNDGSTDNSNAVLEASKRSSWTIVTRKDNSGPGAAFRHLLRSAIAAGVDWIIAIDADMQHDPSCLQCFVREIEHAPVDIVSGSRYLPGRPPLTEVPRLRGLANRLFQVLLHEFTAVRVTDVWCGMKAYRVRALKGINIHTSGYAMPLEFWFKAERRRLRIKEIPIPAVYYERDFLRDGDPEFCRSLAREFLSVFVMALAEQKRITIAESSRLVLRTAERYLGLLRHELTHGECTLIEDAMGFVVEAHAL